MRADARSLLDRLGRGDFAYKEFADRFSDLELWPLFEALLKDPRIFQQDVAEAGAAQTPSAEPSPIPNIAAARPVERMPVAPRPVEVDSLAGLFARYEAETDGAPQGRPAQDVRAMLRRLSELDARGEL